MTANDVKYVKKLTIKACFGKIDRKRVIDENRFKVMEVFGIASRGKPIETDYGTSVGFLGEFGAITASGERFKSAKCYLPKAAEELLEGAVGQGNTVEFNFEIYCVRDDDLATGYFYEVTPKRSPEQSDRFSALFAEATGEAVKKIEAPKPESKPRKPRADK